MKQVLQSITALIIQCCDPDEVVLFGSYAKGNARPDSDVDLLVIGNFTGSKYLRAHELKELLYEFPVRIDVHLYTMDEMMIESRKPFSFVKTMQSNCICLYRKAGIAPVVPCQLNPRYP
jgi:predicted nucleotidyltransferase